MHTPQFDSKKKMFLCEIIKFDTTNLLWYHIHFNYESWHLALSCIHTLVRYGTLLFITINFLLFIVLSLQWNLNRFKCSCCSLQFDTKSAKHRIFPTMSIQVFILRSTKKQIYLSLVHHSHKCICTYLWQVDRFSYLFVIRLSCDQQCSGFKRTNVNHFFFEALVFFLHQR